MELNFSPIRLVIFGACMVGFHLWGGFTHPGAELGEDYMMPRRISRGWFACIALFVMGAGSVSLVDHIVGTIDPKNIRVAYIILGVLLMGCALLWLGGMKAQLKMYSDEPAAGTTRSATAPWHLA